MDKEIAKIIKALAQQEFDVRTTKKGHLVVYQGERLISTFPARRATDGQRRTHWPR